MKAPLARVVPRDRAGGHDPVGAEQKSRASSENPTTRELQDDEETDEPPQTRVTACRATRFDEGAGLARPRKPTIRSPFAEVVIVRPSASNRIAWLERANRRFRTRGLDRLGDARRRPRKGGEKTLFWPSASYTNGNLPGAAPALLASSAMAPQRRSDAAHTAVGRAPRRKQHPRRRPHRLRRQRHRKPGQYASCPLETPSPKAIPTTTPTGARCGRVS